MYWKDYELLDTGNGEKLERWGDFLLRRPEPQAIWEPDPNCLEWHKCHGTYTRSNAGGGEWNWHKDLPKEWTIQYQSLQFQIRPTNFKHTGLFPEQAINWDWMIKKIKEAKRPLKILNLFSYTGAATIACASAGAQVCHVDAAKGMIQWAKDNAKLNGLEDAPIRYIADDVFKFVQREERRGQKYDAIIMDPPSFGRGPKGELWKIEQHLYPFLDSCMKILVDRPTFVLVNTYTALLSPSIIKNLLTLTFQKRFQGQISAQEIGLQSTHQNLFLPCGMTGRWEA